MFRAQQEYRLHLAAKSPQDTPPSASFRSEAEDGVIQPDESDAHRPSTTVVPQLLVPDNSHLPLQEEHQQNQQQLLQQLLEDQDSRFEQLLQNQEHRLKEAFSSQIAVLVATINTLIQRAAARVEVGVQCSELEGTTAGGLTDSSLSGPDHASPHLHVISVPAGAPTADNADSASLSSPPTGGDASEAAPALLSARVPQYSTSAEEEVALMSLPLSQPPRAQSQAMTSMPASDHAPTEVHIIPGTPTSNSADSASLSGPPTGDDASEAAPALLSAQAPHSSTSAAERVAVTSHSSSQPPRAQRQARTTIKAPLFPFQSLTRQSTPPIPIPKTSGAHVHKVSRSGRSQSTDSPEGSSPRISAFQLGLSANDVISSSDRGTDSDTDRGTDRDTHSEDEVDWLPISSRQLESSSEESGNEASGSAWVSSLGRNSSKKGLSALSLRPMSANAPKPRARAIGGELAAARARTPAAALTALRSTATASLGTVRPASALTAVATGASPSALRPASTATAGPTAVAPRAALIAAAPAVSAEALAEPLADALSAGRPTATAALSPAQHESAQTLQADVGQLADAVEVMAEVGAEEAMPVQAAEADAAQLSAVAPAHDAAADGNAAEASVADADAAQPANADATEAVLSAASDALTISMDLARQADSATLHQVIDGDQQFVTSEGQEFPNGGNSAEKAGLYCGNYLALGSDSTKPTAAAHQLTDAQSAAPEEGVHSAAPLALGRESTQPTAAAEQDVDFQTAMSQRSLSSKRGEDSRAEDSDADDDYLGSFSWEASTFTSKAASSPQPAAPAVIAASGSAVAGSTAVAATEAHVVSVHTAVASLGTSEDRSGKAAAGTAEGNVCVSQPTDDQTAVSHDVEEDCKEDAEEEAQVNTSLGYTAFVTDSLLGRMEQQAGSNGGDITALDVRDHMDLVDMGGPDNQVYYNYALLEGVNEQLAAAKHKMQPPTPALQQLTPLRRPLRTPRAVACAVHDDIMRSVHLAEASMPDGFKHSRLLCQEAKDHQKTVDEGTAQTEASLKMAIADSIFDDIVEDTAIAFLDAHGLQDLPEPAGDSLET